MESNFHGISNDDIFNNKKSRLNEFGDFFKIKIFQVVHITLKYDNISLYIIYILCFVELMQLMTFPFHTEVK